MAEIPGFYPVTIRESRYSGTYSGGRWVLMAGCYKPDETDAFGGDIPCMEFWRRVDLEGPVITLDGPHGQRDVYVSSGDDLGEMLAEARQHVLDDCTFEYVCWDCDVTHESEKRMDECPECGGILFRKSTNYNG